MAIQLKTTADYADNGVKILVYGQAGAGKTSLIPTLPAPIILSAEAGLLSIKDSGIPCYEIHSYDDMIEAYNFIYSNQDYQSVAIDSLSEIGEVILNAEKAANKDGRKAYGEMADKLAEIIRRFRDLPGKHVYFTAKLDKVADEMGRLLYSPAAPGAKNALSLPYFFDEVLPLRVEKDPDGNPFRVLQCASDGIWQAKDRSGKLGMWETPDLGSIINKIKGMNNG